MSQGEGVEKVKFVMRKPPKGGETPGHPGNGGYLPRGGFARLQARPCCFTSATPKGGPTCFQVPSRMSRCRRLSSVIASLVWHSQMVNTFHPSLLNCLIFRLSRATFPDLLVCQNSTLVAGTTRPYLHLCMWKKQPWTKIAIFLPGITMSGFPGRPVQCSLYRSPILKRSLRTTISGLVFLSRIAAMFRLRCSGVCTSVIALCASRPR